MGFSFEIYDEVENEAMARLDDPPVGLGRDDRTVLGAHIVRD